MVPVATDFDGDPIFPYLSWIPLGVAPIIDLIGCGQYKLHQASRVIMGHRCHQLRSELYLMIFLASICWGPGALSFARPCGDEIGPKLGWQLVLYGAYRGAIVIKIAGKW